MEIMLSAMNTGTYSTSVLTKWSIGPTPVMNYDGDVGPVLLRCLPRGIMSTAPNRLTLSFSVHENVMCL